MCDEKLGSKISDFNRDIDQLVDHLDIDQFSIFGVSGGGPYALSYATAGNPKLFRAGMVASAYELNDGKFPKDMCRPNKLGFLLAKYLPFLLRFSFSQQKKLLNHNPSLYMSSLQKHNSHLCVAD